MKFKKSILMLCTALAVLAMACSENESITEVDEVQLENSDCGCEGERAYPEGTGILKEGYLDGQKITYEEINGEYVFEGDIILPKSWVKDNALKSVGRTRAKWPNKTVYYYISSSVPSKSRVESAIRYWESKTDLRFVKRTNQRNYVYFRSGSGCSSSVGMVGGRQYIRLSSGCSKGNIIHEIGHAVGLWHEQSRADRDKYITIHWQNIKSGKDHNFKTYKQRGRDGREYTSSLDFGSIMMYGPKFFSKNGKYTITKKNGSSYSYQRSRLSSGDLRGIRAMY